MSVLHDFTVTTLSGEPAALSCYRDQVLLIVNTASQCGFTPQYRQLQELYERFHAQGFSVLGFPCNQFGHQEPGNANAISVFCTQRYGVTFPLFAKIKVNGKNADPLFAWLKHEAPGLLGSQSIKWNFTKFLVNRAGNVVARHAPQKNPLALVEKIVALLGKQP